MTLATDGLWLGWNGGECPTNPYTVVEIVTTAGSGEGYANTFVWNKPDHLGNMIVAYRVVKEHREPREFWLDPDDLLAYADDHGGGLIHVREVLE